MNKEIIKEVCQQIKDKMYISGITQTQLSELTGIKQSAISLILSGNRNFGIETLIVIFKVLKIKTIKIN